VVVSAHPHTDEQIARLKFSKNPPPKSSQDDNMPPALAAIAYPKPSTMHSSLLVIIPAVSLLSVVPAAFGLDPRLEPYRHHHQSGLLPSHRWSYDAVVRPSHLRLANTELSSIVCDGLDLDLGSGRVQYCVRGSEHPSLSGHVEHVDLCHRVRWCTSASNCPAPGHKFDLAIFSQCLKVILPHLLRLHHTPPRHLISKRPKQPTEVRHSSQHHQNMKDLMARAPDVESAGIPFLRHARGVDGSAEDVQRALGNDIIEATGVLHVLDAVYTDTVDHWDDSRQSHEDEHQRAKRSQRGCSEGRMR